jgi:hypothetical protein
MRYDTEARFMVQKTIARHWRSAGIRHAHRRIQIWEKASAKLMVTVSLEALHFIELTEETAPTLPLISQSR